MRLNITSTVLDKLGFEYWDENGSWGGRTLTFSDGTKFRIVEQCETDDDTEGYGDGRYIAQHWYFTAWFALTPPFFGDHRDLFFLDEMVDCIAIEYSDCLKEFVDKCNELKMGDYI